MTSTHSGKGENEEEFVDVLEELMRSGDLGHAFRTFSPSPYDGGPPCSAADLPKAVLESQYLRYVVQEIATEKGSSLEEVREEASVILEEMSQKLQMGFIRLMAYILSKVFKRIFTGIYVNTEGLNALKQAIQEGPVIVLPNHRSYLDFLVISYVMFTYDIPVPVIAAGMDLSKMKVVGEIISRSGAFFIRRTIGSDKLYWAVLSEYVKTIVKTGFAPLEFFVEGLRSRSLKSLMPKFGMMHMVLEPFFKGEVYDIKLVPISLSYDRVMEESLLAQELLGIPKPKESTTGLLKARKVLQEDYGTMHVNFGRPLSVRHLCRGKINRSQYNLIPRDLPQKPSGEVQACVSWLAHLMVRTQEEGALISPWSLMACLLLQAPVLTEDGLPWHQLAEKTLWLRKLLLDFGGHLNWPGKVPDQDVMSSAAALHHSLVRLQAGRVYLVQEEEGEREDPRRPEDDVIKAAVPMLMLASYRNQCLHVFVRPALLATAIHVTKSVQRDELFAFFCFLRDLFGNEFIFIPGQSSQDFEEACALLRKCGAVHTSEQEVTVSNVGLEVLSFLQDLLQPFIDSYQVMVVYLCKDGVHVISEKQFLPAARNLATKLILSDKLHTYEALSSDMQKNVFSALRRMETLTKFTASELNEYRVNKAAVGQISDILCGKIPPQILQTTPDAKL
ncbi:dihydroxyacetone phosphate acyltransferase-like [Pungitius pungitius]|uniref:dihydroxyacetone phosphate acyltransferase-like n=1 Tax=Pungitius pungitius TaxID=134920 RepID=UPI002E14878C